MSDVEFAIAVGLLLSTFGTMTVFLLQATDLPLGGSESDEYLLR